MSIQSQHEVMTKDKFQSALGESAMDCIDRFHGWDLSLTDQEAHLHIRDHFGQDASISLPFTQSSVTAIISLIRQYRQGDLFAVSATRALSNERLQQRVEEAHMNRCGFPREGRIQDS